jgi:hypothetical protein
MAERGGGRLCGSRQFLRVCRGGETYNPVTELNTVNLYQHYTKGFERNRSRTKRRTVPEFTRGD